MKYKRNVANVMRLRGYAHADELFSKLDTAKNVPKLYCT